MLRATFVTSQARVIYYNRLTRLTLPNREL